MSVLKRLGRAARRASDPQAWRQGFAQPRKSALELLRIVETSRLAPRCLTGPSHVTINIEGRCNYRCAYCIFHGPDRFESYKKWWLDYDQARRQIDAVRSAFGKDTHIHICGTGEPFLNRDIFKVLDYLNQIGNRPTVLTNGSRIVSRKIDQILDANLKWLATDLDTLDPEEYRYISGRGDLEFALESFSLVASGTARRGNDTLLVCNTILTKYSLPQLRAMMERIADLGFSRWNLTSLSLEKSQQLEGSSESFLTPENALRGRQEEIAPVLKELQKDALQNHDLTVNVDPYFDPEQAGDARTCNSMWNRLMLNVPILSGPGSEAEDSYGNVSLGCSLGFYGEFSLGNMFSENLADMWNGEQMRDMRRRLRNNEIDYCRQVCTQQSFG